MPGLEEKKTATICVVRQFLKDDGKPPFREITELCVPLLVVMVLYTVTGVYS